MEWQIGSLVPVTRAQIEVWLTDGSVRRVRYDPHGCGGLAFVDCTHPAQNVYCQRDRVQAWRMPKSHPQIHSKGTEAP